MAATLRLTDEQIARVCHDANRALQLVTGDPAPSPGWEHAPQWQRDSSVDSVVHLRAGMTPSELHDRWRAERVRAGWTLGPVKDDSARTHPSLVGYDDLPPAEVAKDELYHAIVAALAGPR